VTDAFVPPLARALGAKLRARRGLVITRDPDAVDTAFIPAVVAMDAADRAYRAAIERILERDRAQAVLGAMAAFRAAVARVRAQAREEIAGLYAAASLSYGAYDPLDDYVPPAGGLAHVDGVRAADVADRAKANVIALRRDANARIAGELGPHAPALIAAKQTRNAAFAGALHAVVVPLAGARSGPVSDAIEALAALADAWY
jgi:hypothetical protein